MDTSWTTVDTVWESSCGKFMGISWKKGSRNPAGKKQKATMAMSWEMHGNVMEHSGHFLGKWNFVEKASSNPAVKNQKQTVETSWKLVETFWESWKAHGKLLESSWNGPGHFLESSWEFHGKSQQQPSRSKKNNNHGNFMEHAWKLHGK